MKITIQILLITWFAVAAGFVLIAGIGLAIASGHSQINIPSPPPLPNCKLGCDNPPSMEAWLKVYAAQTAAYERQVAAIKAKADAERSPALETYKAVAKDTIQPLLTTMFTALLAYVFVKGTATVVNNAMLVRGGKEPERLNLP